MNNTGQKIKKDSGGLGVSEEGCFLLEEYHSQGLRQARISFWFSMGSACVGFAVIILAIVILDDDVEIMEQSRPFLTFIAGTAINAVSALFFAQSNKARLLMIEFFDKYRMDRNLQESLKLATEIADPALQSKLRTALALKLAGVHSCDDALPSRRKPRHLSAKLHSTARKDSKSNNKV